MASALERRLHRLEERTQAEQDTLHPTAIEIWGYGDSEPAATMYLDGRTPSHVVHRMENASDSAPYEPPTDDRGTP